MVGMTSCVLVFFLSCRWDRIRGGGLEMGFK